MEKIKSIGKTIIVILLVLCVGVMIIEMLDTPVAEEGEELNTAQQVIVWCKGKITKLLSFLNTTSTALLGTLIFAYKKQSGDDSATLDSVKSEVDEIKNSLSSVKEAIDNEKATDKKIDALLDVVEASELPAEQRAKLKSARNVATTVVESVKSGETIDLNAIISAVKGEIEKDKQVINEEETTDTTENTPSYFG